jgi:hypothetical protein
MVKDERRRLERRYGAPVTDLLETLLGPPGEPTSLAAKVRKEELELLIFGAYKSHRV